MSAPSARPRFDWARLAADFDRWNRVLIPKTKAEKERFRTSRTARLARRLVSMTERLTDEGQAFLVVAFVAGLAAIDAQRSQVYVAWGAVTSLVLASVAISAFVRASAVRVEVAAPRRVTVGDEASFTVALRNEGTEELVSLRVRGSFLPWDGSWTSRAAGVPQLAAGAETRVVVRARFFARGAHVLAPINVRALVPLGFALGPPKGSDPVRVLVVPRVARVESLALPQTRRHNRGGVPKASHTAEARELAGVRPYRIGDPVRDLHARTWARIGEPVVREHREEYFARVGVILDTDLGRASPADFEGAVSLVAGVVARVLRTEALVDLVVLGQRVHAATVGRSTGTLDGALDLLAAADPEGPFDAETLLLRLRPHFSRLSSLVFVTTGWDDARRTFVERVEAAGVACSAYVVGPGADEARVRHVALEAIRAGEALRL